MKGRLIFGFLIFSFSWISAQSKKCFLPENSIKHQLNISYSKNVDQFIASIEYAATKFPELKEVDIEFKRKKIGTMMAARPKLDFLFKKKKNRKYVIYITNHPAMNAGLIFDGMSECAQVGVIGHELSHILSYKNKSNLQMLWFGILYPFNKSVIEEKTDITTMKRGFADHLLEYTRFIHSSPHTNPKYLQKKIKHYLSVNEMEEKYLELL